MPRWWTCQGCGHRNPRLNQKCQGEGCLRSRPAKRVPKHQLILETPYEWWVEKYGERCGICGRPPGPSRRLDRDHWHSGLLAGQPRGLLCHRCNRALPDWIDSEWLRKALWYFASACQRCGGKLSPFPGSSGGHAHGPGFCIDRRQEEEVSRARAAVNATDGVADEGE